MDKNIAFDFLRKISFERLGGSPEELKAANYILEECKKSNVEACVESFNVDYAKVTKAKFEILQPLYQEYKVTGYMMSGSTSIEGLEAEFLYVEEGNEVDLLNASGKIVMINSRMGYDLYKRLCDAKVVGFVSLSGTLYDKVSETDLEERSLRKQHYEFGKIPGVTIRIAEAQELLLSRPTKARLTLIEEEGSHVSQNVVATIKGSRRPKEIITFTAHYDSVRFSTGAYDNATGTISILELMHYFTKHTPQRTLKFVWCGSEEMGLLGSKAYIEAHKEELKNYKLCINVDMTSPTIGYDIAVCTAENSLVNYLDYLAKEQGHSLKVSQGVYSSDSTPFADNGIPAVSFARVTSQGGAMIHSRKDVVNFLDEDSFMRSLDFMVLFASKMVNAAIMPIPYTIPQNMIEKLDEYNRRKK